MSLDILLGNLQADQARITLDRAHRYRVEGKPAPGVTTIIKVMDAPILDAWKVRVQVEGTARAAYANPPYGATLGDNVPELEEEEQYVSRLVAIAKEQFEHERLSGEAADIGKQVHALIEHEVRTMLGQPTEPPTVTDEALFIFAGWREWAKDVGLKPLRAEGRVFHRTAHYCGTFDLLAMVEGRPSILDWKAKKGDTIYPEMRLQSAAYRAALNSAGWPELDGYVVRLPKDGGEIVSERMECGEAQAETFDSFMACLRLYRWQASLRKNGKGKSEAA